MRTAILLAMLAALPAAAQTTVVPIGNQAQAGIGQQQQTQQSLGVGLGLGGTSTATGSQNTDIRYDRPPVSSAISTPGWVPGGDTRCSVGVGGAGQGVGLGLSFSGVMDEPGCERVRAALYAARFNFGGKGAETAHRIMCADRHYRAGSVMPCPKRTPARTLIDRHRFIDPATR